MQYNRENGRQKIHLERHVVRLIENQQFHCKWHGIGQISLTAPKSFLIVCRTPKVSKFSTIS